MVQPQPGCVNLRHAGRTNHHIYHHMTLRPYHSHHTLQKQVRRTTCSTKVALEKPLQRESNGGPAGRSAGGGSRGDIHLTELHRSHLWNPYENLIRVIASPQIRAIHNASIFTRSITLTVQTLHLRRLHLHMTLICWFNLLTMHTVSPDGDSSR